MELNFFYNFLKGHELQLLSLLSLIFLFIYHCVGGCLFIFL